MVLPVINTVFEKAEAGGSGWLLPLPHVRHVVSVCNVCAESSVSHSWTSATVCWHLFIYIYTDTQIVT